MSVIERESDRNDYDDGEKKSNVSGENNGEWEW